MEKDVLLEKLGSADTRTQGLFRAYVAGVSTAAAVTLGLMCYIGTRALDKIDALGIQGATADIRLRHTEAQAAKIERQTLETLQRVARIEGILPARPLP